MCISVKIIEALSLSDYVASLHISLCKEIFFLQNQIKLIRETPIEPDAPPAYSTADTIYIYFNCFYLENTAIRNISGDSARELDIRPSFAATSDFGFLLLTIRPYHVELFLDDFLALMFDHCVVY